MESAESERQSRAPGLEVELLREEIFVADALCCCCLRGAAGQSGPPGKCVSARGAPGSARTPTMLIPAPWSLMPICEPAPQRHATPRWVRVRRHVGLARGAAERKPHNSGRKGGGPSRKMIIKIPNNDVASSARNFSKCCAAARVRRVRATRACVRVRLIATITTYLPCGRVGGTWSFSAGRVQDPPLLHAIALLGARAACHQAIKAAVVPAVRRFGEI